jgi:hypothetical protein
MVFGYRKEKKLKTKMCLFRSCMLSIMMLSILLGLTHCSKKGQESTSAVNKDTNVQSDKTEFSAEVKQILEKKKVVIENLAKDPLIIKAVKETNERNRNITMPEILRLDEKWQKTEGLDEFIKSFIINECGRYLVEFQEANEVFSEIFITDEKGLIVGETNKTSDYLQAVEDWWIKAFNKGNGMSYYGVLEYDKSSRTEAISLYVPVRDLETKKVIGIIKAVCDITAIKMEL